MDVLGVISDSSPASDVAEDSTSPRRILGLDRDLLRCRDEDEEGVEGFISVDSGKGGGRPTLSDVDELWRESVRCLLGERDMTADQDLLIMCTGSFIEYRSYSRARDVEAIDRGIINDSHASCTVFVDLT